MKIKLTQKYLILQYEKLEIGIVGLGRMGKIHFDNINLNIKQATILGVSNLNPENKKWVKERSDAKIYDHYDKMVRDSKIDAIIISSPTSFHRTYKYCS